MFYGVGIKRHKEGETHIIIDNLPNNRVLAVKEAERISKKEKIELQGVYLAKSKR